MFFQRKIEHGRTDGAALGDKRGFSRCGHVGRKTGIERLVRADNAHAVGTDNPDPALLGLFFDLFFQFQALFSGLPPAGRYDDRSAHTQVRTFPDNPGYRGDGRGNHGQIHCLPGIGQGGKSLHAKECLILWIDRENLSLKSAAGQVLHDGPADASLGFTGTDYCHGSRFKYLFQMVNTQLLPPFYPVLIPSHHVPLRWLKTIRSILYLPPG